MHPYTRVHLYTCKHTLCIRSTHTNNTYEYVNKLSKHSQRRERSVRSWCIVRSWRSPRDLLLLTFPSLTALRPSSLHIASLLQHADPRAFALTALRPSAPYSWLHVPGSLINCVKSASPARPPANPLESVPVSKMIARAPSYGILPTSPRGALRSSLLPLLGIPTPSSLLYSVMRNLKWHQL